MLRPPNFRRFVAPRLAMEALISALVVLEMLPSSEPMIHMLSASTIVSPDIFVHAHTRSIIPQVFTNQDYNSEGIGVIYTESAD